MRLNMNRWQAFLIHAGLSFIIFAVLLSLIWFVWYPGIFINMGGWQGVKIIGSVGLVLGPLLTLIVFNPVKKSLKWDLLVIGVVQIACLVFGMHVVYSQRPVAQVLGNDGIHIVIPEDYKNDGILPEALKSLPGSYPKVIFLDLPSNAEKIEMISTIQKIMGGLAFNKRSDLYKPFNHVSPEEVHQRVNKYSFDEKANCYIMPIHSIWFNGDACFHLKQGVIYFVKNQK